MLFVSSYLPRPFPGAWHISEIPIDTAIELIRSRQLVTSLLTFGTTCNALSDATGKKILRRASRGEIIDVARGDVFLILETRVKLAPDQRVDLRDFVFWKVEFE